MTRTVLNVFLGLILLCLITASWVWQRDYRQPNVDVLPNMVASIPYDAFSPNSNFMDGKTLQAPPSGTLAHGEARLPYQAKPQDALRAGIELVNPFGDTNQAALKRGAECYRRFCVPCHGPKGTGDGQVAKRGFPPPPSLLADHARGLKEGHLFHIMTYGQGNMPAHAAQISLDDRWRIGLHIRKMQQESAPKTAATTTASNL